jgi:pantoate--beta-alanine ligase
MKILTTVEEMKSLDNSSRRGAVFTMGALHEGHLALMHECRKLIGKDGLLIVTIFVNPTQFTDPKDLEKYPRTLDTDVEMCAAAGVDVVFAPTVAEMYPAGVELPQFSAGRLGNIFEGASRPGHFDAVATVVHRLLDITQPSVTCFGEKDFQQLAVVRAMVAEAKIACEVVGVPTVRDADGVAKSSRNRLLSPEDRAAARVIPQSLERVAEIAQSGDVSTARSAGLDVLKREPRLELDYLEVVAPDFGPAPEQGAARAIIAARVGGVRLIDNYPVTIGGERK